MKDRQTAFILIGCAVLLAVGSYLLLTKSSKEGPVHQAEIKQVVEPPAQAPDWVNDGQKPEPDYSASTAQPVDKTPAPTPPSIPQPIQKNHEPQTIEISEDKIVTFTFVESLTDFILNRFQPMSIMGKPATLASTMSLNKYFGREMNGFAISGNDILATRKAVLDYAFNPAMLKTLYELYAPAFLIHLVDTAATEPRQYIEGKTLVDRTLTSEEIADMLRLNSRRIEQTATLFRAFAKDPSLTEMAGRYLRAAKAVERANGQLQTALADEKDTGNAGSRLKRAILQREQVKAELISKMKQICHACPENELFYLSQWAYRRVLNEPEKKLKTFETAADIMDDLANRFLSQAKELQ